MVVGVVIYRTGQEKLSDLGGLWRVMPLTAVVFTVAALSISGFPGFNGFVSKGMVTAAAHKQHLDTIYYLLLAAGVGTFLSFMKLGYYAFLQGEVSQRVPDANRGQQAAMGLVAALCILFGLVPDPLFAMLPGTGASEAHPFTVGHIAEGVVLATIALVIFGAIKTPLKKIPTPPDVDALYNPTSLYGTRAVVVAVTETYAAVDGLAVGVATLAGRLAREPRPAVDSFLIAVGRRDGTEDDPASLRAGLGTSVTLVVVVVTVVVLALLL
jgi:multicomponent Na+:H+ antiporter subunit D